MQRRAAWFMTLALSGAAACGRAAGGASSAESAPGTTVASGRLATPYPLDPFRAVDLDGRDVSLATWQGRVVVINVWATWCPPCRREIPALAAIQDRYRDRVLVIGLLQDNVTDEFVRAFGRSVHINYPVVRSTFEIESRFPQILAIPMTFIVDAAGRLAAMYAGELDPVEFERDLKSTLRTN